MPAEYSDPPVVVVVVTRDPGAWFEETLGSLAAQDHPNLSFLIVDAGSRCNPAPRVAVALPGALVHRLDKQVTNGQAANEALGVVRGASHFLLCHDDVALAPDATRLLVGEAISRNAGIASPKLVDWDQPDRLLAVGLGADRVGVVHGLIERGELDQEQHDAVKDIFVAPGAATLVRADLFASLGGFDAEVGERGEDLDLSWRAHLAGARVVVVPAARVRHLEACAALPDPRPPAGTGQAEALTDQHRIRTLLCCYGWRSLVWVIPLVVAQAVGGALGGLAAGHPRRAVDRLATPVRAMRSPGELWRVRRRVQHQRRLPDRTLRGLQSRGDARLRAWVDATRPAAVGATRPAAVAAAVGRSEPATPDMAAVGGVAPSDWRAPLIVGGALLALLVVGSRHLLGHDLPAIGTIPATSGGVGEWGRAWWSTWQPAGLGSTGPSPPALGILVLGGAACLGAVGTLQHILVLGPLVLGPLGVYRAARSWGSPRGRIAALVAYTVLPIPYNALAGGHWDGLVAYTAAPWALGLLGRFSDSQGAPEGPDAHRDLRHRAGRWLSPRSAHPSSLLFLGLLTALVGAFVPSFLLVVPVVGVGLALGSLLIGGIRDAARLLLVATCAGLVGAALLLPWSLQVATSPAAMFGAPAGATGRLSFGTLLRMHTGPFGAGPLGWGLLVAAALPLLAGRSWRLAWAARLWLVMLVCVAWAWLGLQGRVPAPSPDVVLAPAGAALAFSVGLGVAAFELDLPRYRFGWRQGAAALAAAGVALNIVAFAGGVAGGRWHLPSAGSSQVLAGAERPTTPASRLLWVGAPGAIPLASAPLAGGLSWATSLDGAPDVTDEWAGGAPNGAAIFTRDIRLAQDGLTTDLGHLLAPLGVRYVVLPNHDAPSGTGAAATPTSAALQSGLSLQTDLAQIALDANYIVYGNAAWRPDGRPAHVGASVVDRAGQLLLVAVWAELAVVGLVRRRPGGTVPTALDAGGGTTARAPDGRAPDGRAARLRRGRPPLDGRLLDGHPRPLALDRRLHRPPAPTPDRGGQWGDRP